MQVKKISLEQDSEAIFSPRPLSFEDFVWQTDVKIVLESAIKSALTRKKTLGHVLLAGQSWFGKTTLAQIIAGQLGSSIRIITGYALSKPSDLISVLSSLEAGDVLFIDEIHRLRPNIEEVLYIAMEDFVIDMVMSEWGNVRVPLQPFTLVGATTRLENLSEPLKNRFVYKFHFMDYGDQEKVAMIERYLSLYGIEYDKGLLEHIVRKVHSVPREIHNFCLKVRDFIISQQWHHDFLKLDSATRTEFLDWLKVDDGWLTQIHRKYLEILTDAKGPVALKTLALKLGMNELSVEEDVESLLLKLGKIEKTSRGRMLAE